MPCSDAGMSEYYDNKEKQELKLECAKLEGMLCALFSVLDSWGITEQVVEEASTNGEVDLELFWKEHKEKDRKRLKAAMSQYSKDEIRLIKELLKDVD